MGKSRKKKTVEPYLTPTKPIGSEFNLWSVSREAWVKSVLKGRNLLRADRVDVREESEVWVGTTNCQGIVLLAAVDCGLLPPETDLNMGFEDAYRLLLEQCDQVDRINDYPRLGDIYLYDFTWGHHVAVAVNFVDGDPLQPLIFHASRRLGRCVTHGINASWTAQRKGIYSLKDLIN